MSDGQLDEVVPFETDDGSMTLYDGKRDIHYRSWHGAKSESQYVFLEGTNLLSCGPIWTVCELGFGAAVNFCQVVEAFRADADIDELIYHSVDWRPVTPDHLTFHQGPAGQMARQAVGAVHERGQSVVEVTSEDDRISLVLHATPWEEADVAGLDAQAFFHDPFSKRVNPKAWTATSFARARSAMNSGGRLATYSAATSVKCAMFEAGLWVASAPGPGRKREMTIASPTRQPLRGLELLDRQHYLEKCR